MNDYSAVVLSVPAGGSVELQMQASSHLKGRLRVTAVDETAFQRMQLTTGLMVGILALILVLSIIFSLESVTLLGQKTGSVLVLTTLFSTTLVLLFLTDDNLAGVLSISSILPYLFVLLEYSASALALQLVAATTPPKFVRTGYIAILILPVIFLVLSLLLPDRVRGLSLLFILTASLYRLLGMLRQTLVSPEGKMIFLAEAFSMLQFTALLMFFYGMSDSSLLVITMMATALMRILNVKSAHTQRLIRKLKSQNMQDSLQTLRIRRGGEQKLMDTRESLSGFLHDIRQPLSAINFTAQAQIRLSQMAQRDDALWQRVLNAQRSVDEILNSLIGRIRSNLKQSASFGVQEISLRDLVTPIIDEYREQIRERNLSIRLQCCEATVLTDVVAVRRIVRNAVDNAFKHCKQGKILVGCRQTRSHVRIQVWDTGPGFEGYTKTIQSTGSHTGNKVVFDLVRSIGGEVDVKSMHYLHGEYSTGTRFELRFPRVTQAVVLTEKLHDTSKLDTYRFEGVLIDPMPDEHTEALRQRISADLCETRLHIQQRKIFDLIDSGVFPVFVVIILRKSMFGIEHPLRLAMQYHGAAEIPTIYLNVNDEVLGKQEWENETVISKAFNDADFILRTLRIQTGLSRELLSMENNAAA
jgi:signal transduction histidine kinase